ncbi:septum formation initiator family protein [Aureibaculum sp. 2210JD6-5]|uniref:FtsB family cell division protein n=1 Tax=Aureibaculum sp. 2210JD6-5 TaxID=3103957 RepID=UPI002AADCE60|nr:septum formation initiator family protein [Aureibaculum sp. 2210JD6-5]MDY7395376.1 septum formation initiator family protein [Aureibaculum sp. 2210JD6-5]
MTFKEFRKHKLVRFFSNRYVIILLLFLIWMLFIDENSYLNHRELNHEINKLEKTNEFYDSEVEKDKKLIKNLKDPDSLEKFAREEYRMKRKDEDIYIIDFDSIKE